MRYDLPALAVDEGELSNIQSKILQSMRNKLGYSSKIPTEIRHGQKNWGDQSHGPAHRNRNLTTKNFQN